MAQSAHRSRSPRVILITAPVGGGKTSVMLDASQVLRDLGVPHAAIDVDALSWCYPSSPDDPFNNALALRNVAHLWSEYSALGTDSLLLSRVVETPEDVSAFERLFSHGTLTVVRLESPIETIHERLVRRASGADASWDLNRSTELAGIMSQAALEDLVVDNDRQLREVSIEVLTRAGWLTSSTE